MNEFCLTQSEADRLIQMTKIRANSQKSSYPAERNSLCVELTSLDKKEQFLLDINRSKISLSKGSYQNRAKKSIILVRLDFGGQPHRNPDNKLIASPHLHIYREGFDDKWAQEISSDVFTDINDLWQALEDFMKYCHIIGNPIEKGLFI